MAIFQGEISSVLSIKGTRSFHKTSLDRHCCQSMEKESSMSPTVQGLFASYNQTLMSDFNFLLRFVISFGILQYPFNQRRDHDNAILKAALDNRRTATADVGEFLKKSGLQGQQFPCCRPKKPLPPAPPQLLPPAPPWGTFQR